MYLVSSFKKKWLGTFARNNKLQLNEKDKQWDVRTIGFCLNKINSLYIIKSRIWQAREKKTLEIVFIEVLFGDIVI